MRPQNLGASPTAANRPAATPTLAPLKIRMAAVSRQNAIPPAKARIATRTLLVNTSEAKAAAGADE